MFGKLTPRWAGVGWCYGWVEGGVGFAFSASGGWTCGLCCCVGWVGGCLKINDPSHVRMRRWQDIADFTIIVMMHQQDNWGQEWGQTSQEEVVVRATVYLVCAVV